MSQNWDAEANCATTDGEVFFAPHRERTEDRPEREALAKRVCRNCRVRTECLNEALTKGYTVGIWGGLTENERQDLHPAEAAAA